MCDLTDIQNKVFLLQRRFSKIADFPRLQILFKIHINASYYFQLHTIYIVMKLLNINDNYSAPAQSSELSWVRLTISHYAASYLHLTFCARLTTISGFCNYISAAIGVAGTTANATFGPI